MEEGNFTMDFFEKVAYIEICQLIFDQINMKDILGDMLFGEGVENNDIVTF